VYFTNPHLRILVVRGGHIAMFEISKPEIENRTFRMPKELLQHLSQVAHKEDISLNKLVIQCCEYALNNLTNGEIESK